MDASDRMADRRNPMSWSTDLQLLLVAVGALWAVTLLPVIRDTPLRILVAVPFALFVPGYALIAVLFPENGGPDTTSQRPVDGLDAAPVKTWRREGLMCLSG